MSKRKLSLADFSHSCELNVSWGDMDALGHINNAIFFRYFEDVRISYFEKSDISYNVQNGIGPILAEISCKFVRPIYYPTKIIAACSVYSLLDDRFGMRYGLFSQDDGSCLAIGDSTVMAFNYKGKSKSLIPERWTDVIKKNENQ